MIVKVCGMYDDDNIARVAALGVDLMGFIFYPPSQRYVDRLLPDTPASIGRVGVFVDASYDQIVREASRQRLSHIQLHGTESPELCMQLRRCGYKVIKTVSIATSDDFRASELFEGGVDWLLFDTLCPGYGGSGKVFDWSLLRFYGGSTRFLLSGGISPQSEEAIRLIDSPCFGGIDLNSRFEVSPGVKNIKTLKHFITKIR